MNKIKIIYDVVKKMRDKNSIKGVLKAEGLKDGQRILGLDGTFEKSSIEGVTKKKSVIEVEHEGKKMKMENSMDLQGGECCGHHDFMRHMHSHHHGQHPFGVKEGWSRITSILGILSSINITENDDKSAVMSLKSTDIPEEIKNGIGEMMKRGHEHHKGMDDSHKHHMFMKEFHEMENRDFTLNVYISKEREIDKVTIDVKGDKEDEKNQKHQMKLAAELCLQM